MLFVHIIIAVSVYITRLFLYSFLVPKFLGRMAVCVVLVVQIISVVPHVAVACGVGYSHTIYFVFVLFLTLCF